MPDAWAFVVSNPRSIVSGALLLFEVEVRDRRSIPLAMMLLADGHFDCSLVTRSRFDAGRPVLAFLFANDACLSTQSLT